MTETPRHWIWVQRIDVDRGTGDGFVCQGLSKRVNVYHGSARSINQDAGIFHGRQLFGADEVSGVGRLGHMQADDVTEAEQFGQRAHLLGVTKRQLGDHVIQIDFHPHGFGQHAQLGSDVSVADDAQFFATGFKRTLGGFLPDATVHERIFFRNASEQQNRLTDYQLATLRVLEKGALNTGMPRRARVQVHLIRADAKTADGQQLLAAANTSSVSCVRIGFPQSARWRYVLSVCLPPVTFSDTQHCRSRRG